MNTFFTYIRQRITVCAVTIIKIFGDRSMAFHSLYEPTSSWREKNGAIYLSVRSDGTTGPEWVRRFESEEFIPLDSHTRSVLESPEFIPTTGVRTHIVILKGELFVGRDRNIPKINTEARRRNLVNVSMEVICLIRYCFSAHDLRVMGLSSIVAMHKPIEDSNGFPRVLTANWRNNCRALIAYLAGNDNCCWDKDDGFAYATPQVGPQA